MKKRKLNFLFFSVAAAISLASCGEEEISSSVSSSSSASSSAVATFRITFNSNGGTNVEPIEAQASELIQAPENPTKNGYKFGGWYTDSNFSEKFQFSRMPKKDTELFAKWTLVNYVINYEVGEGENNPSNPTTYNVNQNDIRLSDPIYEGFYFGGWFTDPGYTNAISVIKTETAMNYILYAKWSAEEIVVDYNINYHLDSGTNGNNPSTFNKKMSNIVLEEATKDGYEFDGWYAESTFNTKVLTIYTSTEHDIDLYAKWTESSSPTPVTKYAINYHLNNGSNSSLNPIRYTEEDGKIKLANPTKVSCTFKGWYEDANFTTPITEIDCSRKEAIDVYAKWLDGISENVIELDVGLDKEYVIYHVSDTHVNVVISQNDQARENSWINTERYNFANSFGERYEKTNLCQSSTENFKNLVSYMNSENPDAVCFSGDVMDCYTKGNFDFVNEEMAKTTSPYVYAKGNHEEPAGNYTGMTGMGDVSFYVIEIDQDKDGTVDLEIVCMNNTTQPNKENDFCYTDGQLEKLQAECAKNIPIVLVEHVPLLTSYNCTSRIEKCGAYFFIDESNCTKYTKQVLDLICQNENIKVVLCGHIHGGTDTVIYEWTDASGVKHQKHQITCSSGLIGVINKIVLK